MFKKDIPFITLSEKWPQDMLCFCSPLCNQFPKKDTNDNHFFTTKNCLFDGIKYECCRMPRDTATTIIIYSGGGHIKCHESTQDISKSTTKLLPRAWKPVKQGGAEWQHHTRWSKGSELKDSEIINESQMLWSVDRPCSLNNGMMRISLKAPNGQQMLALSGYTCAPYFGTKSLRWRSRRYIF